MEDNPEAAIVPEDARAGLTGRAFLTEIAAGRAPSVPMHRTLGMQLQSVGDGEALLSASPDSRQLNLMGGVHGGWFAGVLDSAMGTAVMSMLDAGQAFTTLEIKLNIMRAARPGEPLQARGRLRHRGGRTAVAEAELTRADGTLVATASSTCMIL